MCVRRKDRFRYDWRAGMRLRHPPAAWPCSRERGERQRMAASRHTGAQARGDPRPGYSDGARSAMLRGRPTATRSDE